VNDSQIHEHIEGLVAEEHRLLEHGDLLRLTKGDRSPEVVKHYQQ